MTDTQDQASVLQPLPEWFKGLRPHQEVAIKQVMDKFNAGAKVVFLDAPTGSGKTLIGEMVRREVGGQALYVCSDKALQDQFIRDFTYAKTIKGRKNYATELNKYMTADDCTKTPSTPCMWCSAVWKCPYQQAKSAAVASDIAVLNTSYMLTEMNGMKSGFGGRDICIIDEADTLERALMGYIEFEVPQWIAKKLKLDYPKKGARKLTIATWLEGAGRAAEAGLGQLEGMEDPKAKRQMEQFRFDCYRVAGELKRDVEAGAKDEDEDSGRWLRDYDTKTLKLRPVVVSSYGNRYLWRHAKRFLVMSATIISPDEMVESLGVTNEWDSVEVPMTFPVENRPIILAPIANMTYKGLQDERTMIDMAHAVEMISLKHPNERVLVHCSSYRVARDLYQMCAPENHETFVYLQAADKQVALAGYLEAENGMLFAASMERGVDLKGDACRVQIIAKVPFPSLADRQISARLHLPGGQTWYDVQTVRDIVQMTGRGVRSEVDSATTYVLDQQFSRLWGKSKRLFPKWWTDAVDQTQSIKWLLW
jgi:Rad3-related DNA helicase